MFSRGGIGLIGLNGPVNKLTHLVFRQDLTHPSSQLLYGGFALVGGDLLQSGYGQIQKPLSRLAAPNGAQVDFLQTQDYCLG